MPDATAILVKHYFDGQNSWAPPGTGRGYSHPAGDGVGRWACAPACGATGPWCPGESGRVLHCAHVADVLAEAGIGFDVELARVEALTYAAEEVAGPDGPAEMTPDAVRDWLLGRI